MKKMMVGLSQFKEKMKEIIETHPQSISALWVEFSFIFNEIVCSTNKIVLI